MKNEADQLLEDLDYIRSNAGTAGPDHPKVKKWIGEVRSCVTREANKKNLKKFERLESVKGGSEMWSQYAINPGNVRKFNIDAVTWYAENTLHKRTEMLRDICRR